ncbi:MAG: DUF4450 domain-containing protein [Verrucomicrobiota bacterium]
MFQSQRPINLAASLLLLFPMLHGALGGGTENVPTVLENAALVRRNGNFYNNRPLYAAQENPEQRYYWVFGGDKPLLRFGGGSNLDGTFMPGFQRADGTSKWLENFQSIEARYRPGQMEWVASDPAFPGVTITFHALPLGTGLGMAARAEVKGAGTGDKLVWMFGAAHNRWVPFIDAMAADSQQVKYEKFDPAKSENNGVEVVDGIVRLSLSRNQKGRNSLLACSSASEIRSADADQWTSPASLAASTGANRPIACGVTEIKGEEPITWIAKMSLENQPVAAMDVRAEYQAALARKDRLANRIISNTPDPRFDFIVSASVFPADCLWRKQAFGHGCLSQFTDPLLGWRSTLAGVAYSWHDRVYKAGQTFLASQVKTEDYRGEPALAKIVDNEELARYEGTYCHPGKDPRFHSKGRLIPNQNSTMYDMQSQFVDCLVEDWRFTADPEMEKLLRPALELHLDYIDRVFDPQNQGIYESFSNTFLTDSVWTNGGGTPDETAFAWRGHLAARDMAKRAGDKEGVKKHEAKLALIRKGFFDLLWVKNAGIPGAYREQGGHKRLHPDPWTPGLYLPMDCSGLLSDEQMASIAHFTEYGLQREPRPSGGVRLYPSNWVPAIWSNREKSPGDEYHMALGYCFAGMPEGAFEIINGNISESAFESAVPGQLGVPYGSCGTDFGDCVSAFTRTVVSGVFGYRPDRPNGLVTIAPQFPAAWDHADFKHPEFSLSFKRDASSEKARNHHLSVQLERESAMELQVPFQGNLKSVTLNGKKTKCEIRPGFGRSICIVRTPVLKKADLVVNVAGEPAVAGAWEKPVEVAAEVGQPVEVALAASAAKILDAQGALESPKVEKGKLVAKAANNPGNHRVLALLNPQGKNPSYQVVDINIRDSKAEQFAAEKNLRQAPEGAQWTGMDLASVKNCRITDIFHQDYLSPRPDTMSLRLAKDGYLIWNALYAGKKAPAIDLSLTRPARPAPVYEVSGQNLKFGPEVTIEAWVSADIGEQIGWSYVRFLEIGNFSADILAQCGRLLRLNLKDPIVHLTSPFCGERMTHMALVFRPGKEGQIYFDGQKCFVGTAPVDWSKELVQSIRIGAVQGGKNRFMGRVGRVAIANTAATAEQLQHRGLDAAALPGTIADWQIPEAEAPEVSSVVAGAPTLVNQQLAYVRSKDMSPELPVVNGMLKVPQGAQFKWDIKEKDIAFTSLWDNWPRKVTVPVNQTGDSVWMLVAGSTNPMQVRIANAALRFEYADGTTEQLDLVNPTNFWSLCPFLWSDYEYAREGFSLPKEKPSMVQLGTNCRAMVYGWKLKKGVALKQVTLESLSQEVIVGLMGVSVCSQ